MILMIILLAFAFFIGLVMELYKKKIRKDKATTIENRIVAFLLSGIFGFLFYKVSAISLLQKGLRDTPWLIVPYAIIIYILQRPVCMSFWKPLLKKWMERKLDE